MVPWSSLPGSARRKAHDRLCIDSGARARGPQAQVGRPRLGAPPPAATCPPWTAEDRKSTPLKTIQGLIWEQGYRSGALRAHVYSDVPPALVRWRKEGLLLGVYSSGSIHAQKLLFGHTIAGDLGSIFQAWFDTTTGPKRELASYRRIAESLGLDAPEILFLSDVVEELDAAAEAGFQTCLLVREGPLPTGRHRAVVGFQDVVVG